MTPGGESAFIPGVGGRVAIYIWDNNEEGASDRVDVSPEVAADLQRKGLIYPEGGDFHTAVGEGQATWDALTLPESSKKETSMTYYIVSGSSINDFAVSVEAESREDAIQRAKDGEGDVLDNTFNRWHPDTEYLCGPEAESRGITPPPVTFCTNVIAARNIVAALDTILGIWSPLPEHDTQHVLLAAFRHELAARVEEAS